MDILNRVHGKLPLVFKEKIWRHVPTLISTHQDQS